jgi:quinol monooxygenase YgiN
VKPGSEAEFEQALRRLAICARRDPGVIMFNAHRMHDQRGRYMLYELWRSPQALLAHWQRPYVKNLLALADTALLKPPTDGGIDRRYVSELNPAVRAPPSQGDPAEHAGCR